MPAVVAGQTSGRGRTFALRQLRSLAERNGYPVRDRRLFAESA